MTIVYQILTFLLVVGFFVLLWKSASGWGVTQLIFAALVFIMGLVIIPFAGVAMKSRIAWQKQRVTLQERLENAEATTKQIKYAEGAQIEGQPALVPLQSQLHKLRADAGRVWRGLVLQGTDNNQSFQLAVPAAAPAVDPNDPAAAGGAGGGGAGGAAAAPPGPVEAIPQGLVVHAFAEGQNPEGRAVPTFYLGEFKVAQAAANQVTLEPTGPIIPPVRQALSQNQAGRWSVYEVMPVDGHEPFIAPGSEPTDDQLFGRVDEELVKRLLAGKVSDQTLQAYLRDGSRAQPDDPPATRWTKIEFTEDYEITVDSPEERDALDGGYFDSVGQAVDSRLQRGEAGPVTFSKGDELVVKEEAAQEIIDAGAATVIDTYFVRPLNDYEFAFEQLQERLDRSVERLAILNREIKVLERARDMTIEMITLAQDDKLKLEKELVQYRKERSAIDEYVTKLDAEINSTQQELAAMYQSNLELVNDLQAAHRILENQIESRAAAAVSVN